MLAIRSLRAALIVAMVMLISSCTPGESRSAAAGIGWTLGTDGWRLDALHTDRRWSARVDVAGERLEVDAGRGRTVALVGLGEVASGRGRERRGALVLEGATLRRVLTPQQDGIKEDLVIDEPRDAASFEWLIEVPSPAAPRLDSDGSIRIDAPSRGSGRRDEWFRLPAPTVDDAHGRVEGAARYLLDGRRLRLVANLAGLEFPVTIDPTVAVTTTAELWTGGNAEANATVEADEVRRDAPELPGLQAGSGVMPVGRSNAAAVKHGGFLYILGGRTGTGATALVHRATILGSGSIGSWQAVTPLPSPLELHAAVAHNGYLYAIAGEDGSANKSASVYLAPVDAAGTVGAWTPTTALPVALGRHGAAVVGGRLYVVGGETSPGNPSDVVYVADIRGDGQLGSWSTTASLPAPRRGLRAVAYGDLLFAVGGFGSAPAPLATVEVARVDATGTPSWMSVAGPAAPTVDPAIGIAGGRLFTFGGCQNGDMPCVFVQGGGAYAPVLPDGTLGSWASPGNGCCNSAAASGVADKDQIWVLGGLNASGTYQSWVYYTLLNDTGRLRTTTSTTSLPTARQFHATVSYGRYLYVLGGCETNVNCMVNDVLDTVDYAEVNADGTIGPWISTTPFTGARWGHTAVAYGGYLYIIGGKLTTTYYDDIQRAIVYSDGSLGPWTPAGTLPRPLYRHTSFATDGYLYVAGGADASVQRAEVLRAPFTAGGVGAFTTHSTFPNPRRSHAGVFYDRTLYVLGGYDTAGDLADVQYATLDSAGNFGAWSQGPDLPSARRSHAAVAYNGYLYVTGGYTEASSTYFQDVLYARLDSNGAPDAWTLTANLSGARAAHTLHAREGRLLTTGGDQGNKFKNAVESTVLLTNGNVEPWAAGTNLAASRIDAPLVASGRWLYSIGGYTAPGIQTATVNRSEILRDGTNGPWAADTPLPKVLTESAAIAIDGRIYVVGGSDSLAQSADVYVATVGSDGALSSWTATTPLPSSEERVDHALAYANGHLYVLGGDAMTCTTSVLHAPVSSNGTLGAWTATTAMPGALMGHAAVAYGGYLYVLGGETCAGAHFADVYSAPVNADGSLGAWSTVTSMPYTLSEHAAAASDGFFYVWGGHSNTELNADLLIAPIHENGQIGDWTFSRAFGLPLDLIGGTMHEGRLYVAGGMNDTGFARAEVYVAKATTPAALGVYSRLFDVGLPTTLNTVTVNGLGIPSGAHGAVQLDYRVAGADGIFGSLVSLGDIPLAAPVTLGVGNARYAWLRFGLDDRKAALVTPGSMDRRDIADIVLDYAGGGDGTPPVAGAVNDGTGADIDMQASTSTIDANWQPFTDAESGITGYEWAIGVSGDPQSVQAFTSVGLLTSASATGLTLTRGTTYIVSVRATNGVGLTTVATSDGVLVDDTGPIISVVNDGTGADIDVQTSTSTIDANWAASDPESGIAGYEWAIGTAGNPELIQPFTSTGLVASGSATGLSLTSGTTYIVTVRATNGVGMTSTLASDGVLVDDQLSLAFASTAQTLVAGQCSAVVMVELRDALGAQAAARAATTLALTSNSASLLFYDAADIACTGAPLSSLPIALGQASATFRFADTTAGTPTIQAEADLGAGLVSDSQQQTILAGAATVLSVTGFPSPIVAGTEGTFEVSARDAYGNVATSYAGTVSVSSTDASATFPTPSHTYVSGDAGRFTFRATLVTAGSQTLSASDGTLAGQQTPIVVLHALVSALAVGGIPPSINVGALADLTVRAVDPYGNTATDVSGALTVTSSDPGAQLPTGISLLPADNGNASFPGTIRFATPGLQRVDVSLTATPAIAGAVTDIAVADQGPPWIIQEANLLAAVGAPYRYSALGAVRAIGTLPITFATCASPAGFVLDPASGRIDWLPQAAGPATVCIDATSSFGSDQYTFTVDVQARIATPVTARMTALPAEGPAPLAVQLDGSTSTADPSALPLAFEWFPGDGTPPLGGSPKVHTYLLPGGYHPRLVAFDAFGASGTAQGSVSVLDGSGNQPPRAQIVASQTQGTDALTVSFSCDCTTGSSDIAAYAWDFGGGRTSGEAGPQVTFTPGRYQVTLVVVDGNGLSAHDSVEISVARDAQVPPECLASASPVAGPAPLDVLWEGTFGSATSHVVAFSWLMPDGTQRNTAQVRTQETAAGQHTATLTVRDEQGLECESKATVSVLGTNGVRRPRILSTGATTAQCGMPYSYSQTGRAAADGEAPLTWSLTGPAGAGIDGVTGAVTWTPTSLQAPLQQLVLTVTGPGGSDQQTVDVQVECSTPKDLTVSCGCSEGGPGALLFGALALLALHRPRRR